MTHSPPPKRGRRLGWMVALGLTIAWAVVLTVVLPRRNPDLASATIEPATGASQADFSWTLEGLDGQPYPLKKLKGRAVFLNIWATWCGPCRDELPSIVALAANPRLKDVAFLCASVDEDPEALRQFVTRTGLKLPVARSTSLPAEFRTVGIPATFWIAPDGTIRASLVGSSQWDTPENVDALERLAKATVTTP